jgi:hypothetical protein
MRNQTATDEVKQYSLLEGKATERAISRYPAMLRDAKSKRVFSCEILPNV